MLYLENINTDCLEVIYNYLSKKDAKNWIDSKKIFRNLLLKEIIFNYSYTIEYIINKSFKNDILELTKKLNFTNTKIYLNGKNGFFIINDDHIKLIYNKRKLPLYINTIK